MTDCMNQSDMDLMDRLCHDDWKPQIADADRQDLCELLRKVVWFPTLNRSHPENRYRTGINALLVTRLIEYLGDDAIIDVLTQSRMDSRLIQGPGMDRAFQVWRPETDDKISFGFMEAFGYGIKYLQLVMDDLMGTLSNMRDKDGDRVFPDLTGRPIAEAVAIVKGHPGIISQTSFQDGAACGAAAERGITSQA